MMMATSVDKKALTSEAEPDSTTMMGGFAVGHEVLVAHRDGRFYLGTVVQVHTGREQCLVKFEDNTDRWAAFKELTKWSSCTSDLELLCVVCKKSSPKGGLEIVVCEHCGRGYHRKCHQPEVPAPALKEAWTCRRCTDLADLTLKKARFPKRRDSTRSTTSSSSGIQDFKLPYDVNSLTWDTYHRVNEEQIYCYCGTNGDWFTQMLQCARCKQWFHERCISCLQFPLYCGDRFYIFLCSGCNHGREFVRRLELKWPDIVHLMLFNLTSYNCRKYYDLDTVLVPYINDNWHTLQLPPKIYSLNKLERRENILKVLTTNRNRFKCGKEIKRRTTIWGLRVRLPPPAPCVSVPPTNSPVTDGELRDLWQTNRRLQFLPFGATNRFVMDNRTRELMMGTVYDLNTGNSESDSPCPSVDDDRMGGALVVAPTPLLEPDKSAAFYLQKADFLGAGCAKKSVPFKKLSLHRRKKLLAMSNRDRERIVRRPKKRAAAIAANTCLERTKNHDKSRTTNETLPLTPPTSVSAPPTPPASGSTSIVSDLSNDFPPEGAGGKKVCSELNTPCDTSGDETSSKSTLDQIIPPPKDFEGKNNPFLALMRSVSAHDEGKAAQQRRSKDSITLPLPLTAVIPGKPVMRPTKRQLSEKDIFIGPNGEVKRKRFRRGNTRAGPFTGQTASKTAAVVPTRPDSKEWGEYALNGRRLRQRPEKQEKKEEVGVPTETTPKPSPVKQEPDISLDDLKTSVNIYFGAANRISAGEKFAVRAKRMAPNGKMEYLIEWGCSSNGLT